MRSFTFLRIDPMKQIQKEINRKAWQIALVKFQIQLLQTHIEVATEEYHGQGITLRRYFGREYVCDPKQEYINEQRQLQAKADWIDRQMFQNRQLGRSFNSFPYFP